MDTFQTDGSRNNFSTLDYPNQWVESRNLKNLGNSGLAV